MCDVLRYAPIHGKTAYFSELPANSLVKQVNLENFSSSTIQVHKTAKYLLYDTSFWTTICVIPRILHVFLDTSSGAPILTKLRPRYTPDLRFQQTQRFFWNAPQREVCQMEALEVGFGHLRRFQSLDRAVIAGAMRPEMRPCSGPHLYELLLPAR